MRFSEKWAGGDADLRRVKIEQGTGGVVLPGFIFTQDADAF